MLTDPSTRIQTDIDFHVAQSTKSNVSTSQNKNKLTTQFRRYMALPITGNQTPQGRNISPNDTLKQAIAKQNYLDQSPILSLNNPQEMNQKKKIRINLNYPNSRPQRISTDMYDEYANHSILPIDENLNVSTRTGSSCAKFLMPQSATNKTRTKSVGKENMRSKVKNIVSKIYSRNNNQMNMYYDSNLTNMIKPIRNRSSQGGNVQINEYNSDKFTDTRRKNEITPSVSPQNRPICAFQGRQSKLNYLNESVKRKSVLSIDNENSLFQASKISDNNSSTNQFFQSTTNTTQESFQVQFRNRQQIQPYQSIKQENNNSIVFKQQQQNYLSSQSQQTEDDLNPLQKPGIQMGGGNSGNGNNNKVIGKIPITNSNNQTKQQYLDILISQQNQSKKRSYTQESDGLNKINYNFLEHTKRNDQNNKENGNHISFSQNQSKAQSRIDNNRYVNRSQQPSSLNQRKRIQTEFTDNFEPQKEQILQIFSDMRNKNKIKINFKPQLELVASTKNQTIHNQSHNQSINQNYNNDQNDFLNFSKNKYHNNNQNNNYGHFNNHNSNQYSNSNQINHNSSENINEQQQQQQQPNNYHKRIAQIISKQQQQQENQLEQKIHPKIQFDMTDDEWNTFGDRFPSDFTKIKLLGRGGFALVWLGEDNKTQEQYAIKQISTKNVHQTHIKEIWFGSQFFENGLAKPVFQNQRGINNLIRLAGYDLKPIDTWLFYELSGDSLGTNLYDLKGEGKTSDGERIYKIIYKDLYIQMRSNLNLLKQLIYELAHALLVISDQKIVHSDLKTENILIKTRPNTKNSKKLNIEQVKLIDYGSAFTFGNLKNFSMATPEYMAPEILNYILYSNNLNHKQQLVEYLKDYNLPHVIDIWSLGCVVLELINGIPLWMSLQTKIKFQGQEQIKYGLFAVKNRVFESIIEKQIETINNLDSVLNEQNYSNIIIDDQLRNLLKGMLQINPSKRISPREIIEILQPQLK